MAGAFGYSTPWLPATWVVFLASTSYRSIYSELFKDKISFCSTRSIAWAWALALRCAVANRAFLVKVQTRKPECRYQKSILLLLTIHKFAPSLLTLCVPQHILEPGLTLFSTSDSNKETFNNIVYKVFVKRGT